MAKLIANFFYFQYFIGVYNPPTIIPFGYFTEKENFRFCVSPGAIFIVHFTEPFSCNFTPFSFYLGGARTYYGLPNNPDYDLGAWVGSPCDTLSVGINELEIKNNAALFVFYHNVWQVAFINAKALKGKDYKMNVFDVMGKLVYKEEGNLPSEYFTRDLNCAAFAKGMYIVTLTTERERLSKKFVKE